ncbi:hypothetical protein [Ruegeria hyattellae]|uniref:hypothetical protein n=1 Tax=Ruegeria hyattellae TaxID=3233337 RepID=UPI00355BC7E2
MASDPIETRKSTEGMVDYNRNSSAQQQHAIMQADHIRRLVGKLGRVEPELRLVDYGCGPGMSAIETVRPAIETYRAQFADAPIAVCHSDQPGNDWNALFGLVNGPDGYLSDNGPLRVEAAVGSFYDRLVAENSVSLGTCFFASHWLSHAVRLNAPGTVLFNDLHGAARVQLAEMAYRDWVSFLRHRTAELKPGGYLLVSALGSVPDAAEANGAAAAGRGIYRAMQAVAQSMADDGMLDAEVLNGFVFSLWFMTATEASEAISGDPILATACEVEHLAVTPAPENPDDLFKDKVDDPAEYARLYVGYTKAFADSTLRTQLFEPSAQAPDAASELADEFYRRLDALYRAHTTTYACEIWHLTVALRRR